MERGNEVVLRRAVASDADRLAADMRLEDRRELRRWTGQTPLYEIREAFRVSDVCFTGLLPDGRILSMFGGKLDNVVDGTGVVWELSTDLVNRHPLAFARASKAGFDLVARALPGVEQFFNYVDVGYARAVRWIEWLGGSLGVERFRGAYGGVFARFTIMNPHYEGVF
jgi:hypothetical protein